MAGNTNMGGRPVLITGGAGFIGSHLVRRLLRDGRRVVVLTKETSDPGRLNDVLSQIEVVHDDLSDAARLKQVIQNVNPGGVFHCAALITTSGISAPEDELIKTHISGTIHLLKALEDINYKFFIHCGTCVEYGIKGKSPSENDLCEPVDVYAVTKLAATLYAQSVGKNGGRPTVAFRMFTPYGPDMPRKSLVYEVIKRALHNEEILLSRPEINRDFIFIDDIVELFIEAAGKASDFSGEIFNVGSGKATTLQDFAEKVIQSVGSKSVIRWGQAREAKHDRGLWQANMEKTFEAFTWRPTIDLDAGIRKMAEWLPRKNS